MSEEVNLNEAKDLNPETAKRSRAIVRLSLFAGLLVVIITTVVFFSNRLDSSPTYTGGKVVGKLVPDVTVTTLSGKKIALRSLTGKTVFVNF